MKFSAALLAGALMLVGATAHADTVLGSLSISGVQDTFTSNGIAFHDDSSRVGLGTGVFAYLTGSSATLYDFNFDATAIGQALLTTSTTKFVITEAPTLRTYMNDFLNVNGRGYFTINDVQVGDWGTFHLTSTSDSINGQGITSFTLDGTAAEAPEPSGILLLGTGLLGSAAMLRRRLLA